MTLNDTVNMMNSAGYEGRFCAEYYQLKIRYDKLNSMLEKWDNNTLDFKPICPRSTYTIQKNAMETYLGILEARAKIEKIEL